MDSPPSLLIHGGISADGRALISGLCAENISANRREEDDRRSFDIDIVMEDNFSELSAIAEVTEPLSEENDLTDKCDLSLADPHQQNSDSQSLVAADFTSRRREEPETTGAEEHSVEATLFLGKNLSTEENLDEIAPKFEDTTNEEHNLVIEELLDHLIEDAESDALREASAQIRRESGQVFAEEFSNENLDNRHSVDISSENEGSREVAAQLEALKQRMRDAGLAQRRPAENPIETLEDQWETRTLKKDFRESPAKLEESLREGFGMVNEVPDGPSNITPDQTQELREASVRLEKSVEALRRASQTAEESVDISSRRSSMDPSKLDALIEQLKTGEEDQQQEGGDSDSIDPDFEFVEHEDVASEREDFSQLSHSERFKLLPKSREESPNVHDPIYLASLESGYIVNDDQLPTIFESLVDHGMNDENLTTNAGEAKFPVDSELAVELKASEPICGDSPIESNLGTENSTTNPEVFVETEAQIEDRADSSAKYENPTANSEVIVENDEQIDSSAKNENPTVNSEVFVENDEQIDPSTQNQDSAAIPEVIVENDEQIDSSAKNENPTVNSEVFVENDEQIDSSIQNQNSAAIPEVFVENDPPPTEDPFDFSTENEDPTANRKGLVVTGDRIDSSTQNQDSTTNPELFVENEITEVEIASSTQDEIPLTPTGQLFLGISKPADSISNVSVWSLNLSENDQSTDNLGKSHEPHENDPSSIVIHGGFNEQGHALINGIFITPMSTAGQEASNVLLAVDASKEDEISPEIRSDNPDEGAKVPGVDQQAVPEIPTDSRGEANKVSEVSEEMSMKIGKEGEAPEIPQQQPRVHDGEKVSLDEGRMVGETPVLHRQEEHDEQKDDVGQLPLLPNHQQQEAAENLADSENQRKQSGGDLATTTTLTTRTPAPFVAPVAPTQNQEQNAAVEMRQKKAPAGEEKNDDSIAKRHSLRLDQRGVEGEKNVGSSSSSSRRRSSVELPSTPLDFRSFTAAAKSAIIQQPQAEQPSDEPAVSSPAQSPLIKTPEPGAILSLQQSKPSPSLSPSSAPPLSLFQSAFVSNSRARSVASPSPNPPQSDKVGVVLSRLLNNLHRLRMEDPSKYENIVDRLHALESEMHLQNSGLPPDPELTEIVGKILSSDYPHSDLQIVVSTARKTTSTTQFYETETPGMVGLAPEQLRELQQKLMTKISGSTDYGTSVETSDQPDGLKRRDANMEGWTNEDGKESVTKKSIRQVTTTHSDVTGAGEYAPNKDQLIRLKVNRQVYDGQLDPSGHHIRLVPIQQIPVKYY